MQSAQTGSSIINLVINLTAGFRVSAKTINFIALMCSREMSPYNGPCVGECVYEPWWLVCFPPSNRSYFTSRFLLLLQALEKLLPLCWIFTTLFLNNAIHHVEPGAGRWWSSLSQHWKAGRCPCVFLYLWCFLEAVGWRWLTARKHTCQFEAFTTLHLICIGCFCLY